jgi:lysophospholipase L1-like esterase
MSRILLAVASALFTLLLCEIGLRLFWDDYYVRTARGNTEFHATRGWANRPGATVEFGKPEYRVLAHHNSLGFRGPEVPRAKGAGRSRVLVLGDSVAYGLGVEDDETVSAALERLDPRLEVLNGGVPGYSTVEETLLLREVGLDLAPDLVLVLFLWNDLPGALKESYSSVTFENGVPRFEAPAEPDLNHPAIRAKQTRHPALSQSYLYRFASDRLKILRYMVFEALSIPIHEVSRLEPEQIEPAWDLVRGLLLECRRLAASRGAKLAVAVIPDQTQVEPDVSVVGLDPAVFLVQDRMREFAAREGIPLVDLLPGMRAEHERTGVRLYHRYDRHWNPNGHRLAAELIAPEIARALGLSADSPARVRSSGG